MSEVTAIVTALAGPAGAMILLAVVLFGVWKFLNRSLDLVSAHLTSVEGKFDKATGAIEHLTETIRPLALDMESIARQNEPRKSLRITTKAKEDAQ